MTSAWAPHHGTPTDGTPATWMPDLRTDWMANDPGPQAPTILVTNDDGYDAPGLWKLARAVAPLGRLIIAAPATGQSWAGRAHRSDTPPSGAPHPAGPPRAGHDPGVIALHPRTPPIAIPRLIACLAVTATPARVVRAALAAGARPDLVVSGVNDAHNIGTDATASGTIGAAWEAASDRILALAFSQSRWTDAASDTAMLAHIHALCRRTLAQGLPDGAAVASINFPDVITSTSPWAVTRTSARPGHTHQLTPVATDGHQPRGSGDLLHHGGHIRLTPAPTPGIVREPDSDIDALGRGRVSVTFWPARHGLTRLDWASPDA